MTRAAAVLSVLTLCAAPAPAQTNPIPGPEPTLVFSIYAGLSNGGDLWDLPRQVIGSPAGQDTVSLARRLRPGLTAGLAATYYPTGHFGWTADIGYFGLASEQRCAPVAAFVPDAEQQNEQLCSTANGRHVSTSVVGFMAGLTYRFTTGGSVHPFIRATVGPGLIGNTYIETTGTAVLPSSPPCNFGCEIPLLQANEDEGITWLVNASAGVAFLLAPAYRLRFEVRDVISSLPVVTGPKDPNNNSSYAPTSRRVVHAPTFLFGLDVVLERSHTRRY